MSGRKRVGFLGLGWIGRHRMQAIIDADAVEIVAFAEPSSEQAQAASALVPHATRVDGLGELLARGVDGVVIATPSALHAGQCLDTLAHGAAVFCQKPLGRSAEEVRAVVKAARDADRLLGVDLSYRFTEAARRIRALIEQGALGRIFAMDMVFHNAYGPDKPWFYDPRLSGGGCVIDLGVHLVDLALWMLDFPAVGHVASTLLADGVPLASRPGRVEDYAVATLGLDTGAIVRLACSWNLHAGREAVISAQVHGTAGGATLRNLDGSFYDFTAEHYRGSAVETLAAPPDSWGGRAAANWAARLAAGERFDSKTEEFIAVAEVLDRIYAPDTQSPDRRGETAMLPRC